MPSTTRRSRCRISSWSSDGRPAPRRESKVIIGLGRARFECACGEPGAGRIYLPVPKMSWWAARDLRGGFSRSWREGPEMALLRRMRLVRFGIQVPTCVKRPERENLTRSRPSAIHDNVAPSCGSVPATDYGHLPPALQDTQRNSPASASEGAMEMIRNSLRRKKKGRLQFQERILMRSMLWIARFRRAPYHLS
jgi:hypothetical protein